MVGRWLLGGKLTRPDRATSGAGIERQVFRICHFFRRFRGGKIDASDLFTMGSAGHDNSGSRKNARALTVGRFHVLPHDTAAENLVDVALTPRASIPFKIAAPAFR